jgi:hypothetical protein
MTFGIRSRRVMSAMGHKRKWCRARVMSVFPPQNRHSSAQVVRPLSAISRLSLSGHARVMVNFGRPRGIVYTKGENRTASG